MTTAKVSFRILGATVDPPQLTSEFGIEPTKSHKAGGKIGRHPGRSYPTGAWLVDSSVQDSRPLAEHVEHLLHVLASAAGPIRLRSSTEGWTCSFYCSIFITEGVPNGHFVQLSASTLSRIAALGAAVEMVLYGPVEITA